MKKTGIVALLLAVFWCIGAVAQTDSAAISGRVVDNSGAVVVAADVRVINIETNIENATTTNKEGFYLVPNLKAGRYRIVIKKEGFRQIVKTEIVLHVQDVVAENFKLELGAVSESVTVRADELSVNTQDATVSTVVDRNFAENLPMNGRSFQSLIQLTPGVVTVPSNGADGGQFSVNGQRAESNYWMVDGVSANIGVTSGNFPGNGFGGTLGSFSAQGGTNSLVSVDAMQEFRIQTSTYAPEFGRTPGGQISIVSRSGTNQFHGTLFDYLRNDVLDANDWFADNDHLAKPRERQNDFGGTLGGPIFKDKTFFFFSYEGLRLRLPQVTETTVPDLNARQSATAAIQPFLNAYPFDPNQPDLGNGISRFNASFANSSTLDAYSLRVDHNISSQISIFGRYNYSPSKLTARGAGAQPLSELTSSSITTQTATLGTTWTILPTLINDLRFNYSRVTASSADLLDSFGGAVPLTSLPLPTPFAQQNSEFGFDITSLKNGLLLPGRNAENLQRQINIVDMLASTKGSHALKFGVDYRRLSPMISPPLQIQDTIFSDMPSAEVGASLESIILAQKPASVSLQNLGVFAQDTFSVIPRLTLTYGLRWDLDIAPASLNGPNIVAVTGYNLSDFSHLAIAPDGTAPFKTSYDNFAPRLGGAYQLRQHQGSETVIRGGFGVFYDLIGSTVGTSVLTNPPFAASKFVFSHTFPLGSTDSAQPPIPGTGSISEFYAFNPNLKSPYTLQWNLALEQALGAQQTISAAYVGASGRRLLQTTAVSSPPSDPNIEIGKFVDNTASSSYDALQIQFQRRLSHGLQVLASYAWAHSIDDGSAGSTALTGNEGLPGSPNANRGPSDFDIRHTFSAGLTFAIPGFRSNIFAKTISGGWSLESLVWARSAAPVDISDFVFAGFNGVFAAVRPDMVPGQPLYLFGANCASVMQGLGNVAPGQGCPGGKALNPNAFTDPPFDPATFAPLRQGNVSRNSLRGFGATQWDFAVHRDFPIHESLKLQFRAEMFNVLNHPNFGQPSGGFLSSTFGGPGGFGLSSETLNHYFDGGGSSSNLGGGAFSSLYQLGGPRSIQFALKLKF